jgi:hypothetical protein
MLEEIMMTCLRNRASGWSIASRISIYWWNIITLFSYSSCDIHQKGSGNLESVWKEHARCIASGYFPNRNIQEILSLSQLPIFRFGKLLVVSATIRKWIPGQLFSFQYKEFTCPTWGGCMGTLHYSSFRVGDSTALAPLLNCVCKYCLT